MLRLLVAVAYLAILTQAAPQSHGVPTLDGKISGGEPTFIEKHPYQASLQYSSSHFCGAVILSEDFVVTAAHCTDELFASDLSVRAGSSFRNSGGVVIQVADIYQNLNFNRWNFDSDISVLRLASPLPFGSAIAPVALPEFHQPIIAGSIGQVSGWGTSTEGGSPAKQLQVVEVPIVSLEDCRAAYGASSVTDKMVCAGFPEGGKDSCQEDSGGPLVVNGTLVGLVSWRRRCAIPDYPSVYTSIPELRDYITEFTGI